MERERAPKSEALAQTLRASRPQPDARFVNALETRLGLASPSAIKRSPPRRRGAIAVAVGITSIVLTFSLFGIGPLSPGDKKAADADDACRYVTAVRRTTIPEGRVIDGQLRIVERHRPRRQVVRRCR